MARPQLTIERLRLEAAAFAAAESSHEDASLYGVTDGKAVGTYLEHRFQQLLDAKYTYEKGSSAKGIDFPGLNVDMKVTRITRPQFVLPVPVRSAESSGTRILSARLRVPEGR